VTMFAAVRRGVPLGRSSLPGPRRSSSRRSASCSVKRCGGWTISSAKTRRASTPLKKRLVFLENQWITAAKPKRSATGCSRNQRKFPSRSILFSVGEEKGRALFLARTNRVGMVLVFGAIWRPVTQPVSDSWTSVRHATGFAISRPLWPRSGGPFLG